LSEKPLEHFGSLVLNSIQGEAGETTQMLLENLRLNRTETLPWKETSPL